MRAVERQVALERKAVHSTDVTSVFGGRRKGRGTSLVAFQPCRPFQRDLPPGCLHALFLSLLTQGFCICYFLCLSELPSPETSTAPLQLWIHSWLPKGNSPCPLDHNHCLFMLSQHHSPMVLFMVKSYIYLHLSLINARFSHMSLNSLRAGIVPAFASAWHR